MGRLARLLAALLLLTAPVAAQDMMDHVDLSSPRMSAAELSRADVEALIARAGPGQPVVLTDRSLNGLDLSGLDLAGADLRWARLNRAKLVGTRLAGANLDLAWGIEADFSGADLRGASLFQVQLRRARLDGADLSGSRLTGDLNQTSLKGARLADIDGAADMRNQSMGLMRAALRSAVLDGADLSRARLGRADMEFAKLRGADLSGADLALAQLGGADLTGASVAGLDLTGADLASTTLRDLTGGEAIRGLDQARNLDRAFR